MTAPGLYVHVPFCRTRCVYCAFCSSTDSGMAGRWLEALAREAQDSAELTEAFDTLYIGGGTPSCLDPDQLETLFRSLHDAFAFDPGAEVTLEANPADLDREAAARLAGLGVNRVSLGAQSFDDEVLAFLGRRHRSTDITAAVEALRAGGIHNLSLDLISAVPGLTAEGWQHSLQRVVDLEPQHISCYQLTLEEGTPLAARVERGEAALLDEDTAVGQFLAGSTFLAHAGFEHYEVSNFARGREQRARHNMKYWTHVPYLGLGPSAHSFDGAVRRWNTADVSRYCELLETEGSAEDGRERLTPEQLGMERIALGLRLADGMDVGDLGEDPDAAAVLERCRELDLVTIDGDRIRPTREGLLMADGLARELCSL